MERGRGAGDGAAGPRKATSRPRGRQEGLGRVWRVWGGRIVWKVGAGVAVGGLALQCLALSPSSAQLRMVSFH